jgi:hypothetical protein
MSLAGVLAITSDRRLLIPEVQRRAQRAFLCVSCLCRGNIVTRPRLHDGREGLPTYAYITILEVGSFEENSASRSFIFTQQDIHSFIVCISNSCHSF